MPPPTLPEDYKVGWICALPVEFAAARNVLDLEHESDQEYYALGSIGTLNVVILRILPENDPVSNIASLISTIYTGLRFLLVVGVGSGVPSSDIDIRLGDVVVGLETVQYDGDYDIPAALSPALGARWLPTNTLDKADQALSHMHFAEQVGSSLSTPRLNRAISVPHEKVGEDVLFEAGYDHEGGETCDWCNADRQMLRIPRDITDLMVFYGSIAFGKEVVRDGRTRDRLSTKLGGILCLDTEVTGGLTSLPSLMLRGICDYADSHANEKWRPYAAENAAAIAKLVLSKIQLASLDAHKTMRELGYGYSTALISTSERGSGYLANSDAKNIPISPLFSKGQDLELDDPKVLPFRFIKPLGRGASAVVNMVEDETTGWKFAHKVFSTYYGKTAFKKAKQSFRNEINIMKRLSFNPHIIDLFATYTCGRELGMLLTPVASDGSLADYLVRITDSETGPTIEQQTVLHRSFGCLASGLAYIHKHTIRHKDIKPQNILIHYGRIIYADFGIALDANHESTTTTGKPDGFTQRYCAPEVAEWRRRNRKSDIFSLGCVFVEVLALLTSNPALSADHPDPYWKRVGPLREMLLQFSHTASMDALLRFGTPDSRKEYLLRICHNMLEPQQEKRNSAEMLLQNIAIMSGLAADMSYDYFCSNCAHEGHTERSFQAVHLRRCEPSQLVGLTTRTAIRKTISRPFDQKDSLSEFICIFSIPACAEYVRVARTQDVQSAIRLEEHMPTLLSETYTPFACRVLSLIYAELKDLHYIYKSPGSNLQSSSGWFCTSVEHVTRVVEKYSEWMASMPYVNHPSTNRWELDITVTEPEIEALSSPVSSWSQWLAR